MQASLFENEVIIEKTKRLRPVLKHRNGTKDAISRYSGLKTNLDFDKIYNGNWHEVDTNLVSDKPSYFNFIDLFFQVRAAFGGRKKCRI